MTLGDLFGRTALQLLCGVVLVALAGGGLVWVVAVFFVMPVIGMSVFIFAPIEYVSARFGVRWVAWIVTPFVGAGIPRLYEFIAPSRANFLAGISQLCFVSGVIASLTAAFLRQPPLPDKRLFD
ncbi:hypothetical protein G6L00_09595 [Agrobacterium rhizogenes]|nr:hypothetical protein [Rhizobium rhizogenes]NTH38180.1 hypothetical protein [Rhizobium rhizogenes]NTJ05369.1 hypothetical protein [Rhizobium rhizogenes]